MEIQSLLKIYIQYYKKRSRQHIPRAAQKHLNFKFARHKNVLQHEAAFNQSVIIVLLMRRPLTPSVSNKNDEACEKKEEPNGFHQKKEFFKKMWRERLTDSMIFILIYLFDDAKWRKYGGDVREVIWFTQEEGGMRLLRSWWMFGIESVFLKSFYCWWDKSHISKIILWDYSGHTVCRWAVRRSLVLAMAWLKIYIIHVENNFNTFTLGRFIN